MSPASARSRPRILCVDDDPAMQELMVWKFHTAGMRSFAVSSGRDALRLADAEPIDLFVLDYQMPEMNGEELAAELRQRFPKIPILMISGDGHVPDGAHKLVDRFVPKGVGFTAQLISEVSSLLDASRPAA